MSSVIAILVLVLLGVVYKAMTLDERSRLRQAAVRGTVENAQAVRRAIANIRPCEPFRSDLRARTPRVFVTPALMLLTGVLFVAADVQALGNFGPSTTNGEWWRLLTAMFVHAGMLPLVVSLVGLWQPALLLERLVGHSGLAAVYVAAGINSGLTGIFHDPVGMNAGASGAIFGVYGLLVAAIARGTIRRSPYTIPLLAVKRMVPAAGVFLVYNIASGGFEPGEMLGLATGLGCGGLLVMELAERKPTRRRIAVATAVAMVVAFGSALSIGRIVDVRPEIARVLAIEEQTAAAYSAALDGFRKGRLQAEALVKLIDQTIMPELQAANERLTALDRVTPAQKPLVAHAEEYLRLRSESWRLRSEGLRKTNMMRLRQAERTERASLSALQKISPEATKDARP